MNPEIFLKNEIWALIFLSLKVCRRLIFCLLPAVYLGFANLNTTNYTVKLIKSHDVVFAYHVLCHLMITGYNSMRTDMQLHHNTYNYAYTIMYTL